MVSAMSALGQGIMDPQQHLMIPYALSWIFGNMVFALTDNNVRSAIRSAANADNATGRNNPVLTTSILYSSWMLRRSLIQQDGHG